MSTSTYKATEQRPAARSGLAGRLATVLAVTGVAIATCPAAAAADATLQLGDAAKLEPHSLAVTVPVTVACNLSPARLDVAEITVDVTQENANGTAQGHGYVESTALEPLICRSDAVTRYVRVAPTGPTPFESGPAIASAALDDPEPGLLATAGPSEISVGTDGPAVPAPSNGPDAVSVLGATRSADGAAVDLRVRVTCGPAYSGGYVTAHVAQRQGTLLARGDGGDAGGGDAIATSCVGGGSDPHGAASTAEATIRVPAASGPAFACGEAAAALELHRTYGHHSAITAIAAPASIMLTSAAPAHTTQPPPHGTAPEHLRPLGAAGLAPGRHATRRTAHARARSRARRHGHRASRHRHGARRHGHRASRHRHGGLHTARHHRRDVSRRGART